MLGGSRTLSFRFNKTKNVWFCWSRFGGSETGVAFGDVTSKRRPMRACQVSPAGTGSRISRERDEQVHGYAPEFVDYFLPHVWTMPQRKVVPSEVVERMALRFSLCDFPLFLAECLVIFDGEK